MKRRTESAVTPQKLLEQLIQTRLNWPGKTVQLERNSMSEYQQRSTSGRMSVGEFYHENSKLFPQMIAELTATQVTVSDFQREYVERRSAVVRSSGCTNLELEERLHELLERSVNEVEPEVFYGIELRFLAGESLGAYDAGTNLVPLVKRLEDGEIVSIRSALRLLAPGEEEPSGGPLLFILGSFARHEILFGPRGYRHALLAAGRITQSILSQARRLQVPARAVYDFTEQEVDAAMEADGIELGTLVVIEFGDATHVS